MTTYPRSIETASPKGARQVDIAGRSTQYTPAERKTICTVKGTEKANTQLFIREPEVKTTTCKAQLLRGTCRGLRRGKPPSLGKNKKDGSDCSVMNSI